MNILLTGGAGYIGSHICYELLIQGHAVVVLDNLLNSSLIALERVMRMTSMPLEFVQGHVQDYQLLKRILTERNIDFVVHLAGLKAVGESVSSPLDYYESNVSGAVTLLRAMQCCNVKSIIFSSSATVYGNADALPLNELTPRSSSNPYGRSKLIVEHMLEDLYASDASWKIAILRYFNPVGAHPSGLIGESPTGSPNNLMPYISQVAVGIRKSVVIFGNDYPTRDGTGVRDYIHVVDLAKGHLAALSYLKAQTNAEMFVVNLGRGQGYSVLEVIRSFERVSGKTIRFEIGSRRQGDVSSCYADVTLAAQKLKWRALNDLDKMCADTWRWQENNPSGYSAG